MLAPLRRDRPGPHAGAGGGGLPDLPGPAADRRRRRARDRLLRRWIARAAADRRPRRAGRCVSCWSGWCGPPSSRFPVVGDLARSVRFRWFDQPLVDADRAERARRRPRRGRRARRDPDAPDRAERIDALAAIPEQIVRFLAERLGGRRPGPGADARGAGAAALPRVRPARPAGRSTSRGPSVRDRRLRARRAADPAGLHDRRPAELADPAGRWSPRSPSRSRPGAPGRARSSTSTSPGPTQPVAAGGAARSSAELLGALPLAPTYAGSRSPSAAGGDAPVDYFTFRPGRRRPHGRRRGRPGPRHPPDGRRAGSTCGGCGTST